ncbi:MAG: 50S ribosomal protein L29 [Gemmatimonadota bacterium]|nr:50S ribosomal protein L29 [Gemmatimonadota bacterium]
MKPDEIRAMEDWEIEERIDELEEELFRLRVQNELGQLDNPLVLRERRRDLARLKTIRREAELRAEAATEGEEA